MKKLILLLVLIVPFQINANDFLTTGQDTTILLNNKKIEIIDSKDRTKVKVYEITEAGNSRPMEMVFEGHYMDGRSYEKRRNFRNISIPVPTWDRHFNGHWAGFGMGFANFANGSFSINDIDGVSLRSGKSLEYNLNFLEKSFPFSRYPWAIVTGMGMRWSRYRLNTNEYFKEVDGETVLLTPVDGHLKTSKLNITSLTIPVLLEWQKRKGKHDTQFFVSAGIVGVIKTISSSKIVYDDDRGKKRKDKVDGGLNIHPISVDFLVQAGFDWIGMYAKYSPMELFGSKGPGVHPVSIGLHLHF